MPKKSAISKLVRVSAEEVPHATEADLERLRAAMDGPIDTDEIPEKEGTFRRVKRDAAGHLPKGKPGKPRSPR